MTKIRWGVIGAGGIADRRTIPGVLNAKNSVLTAVMDVIYGNAQRVGKKYDVSFYNKEIDILKRPDIDAVYIATPTYLHLKQVEMAAKNGKHILCEKPMATTLNESSKMIKICKEQKVKLAIGYMMRFHAYHQLIRQMISEGKLGQIVLARAQLTCWYPDIKGAWRQIPKLGGGGALADMGLHCIDLLRYLFQSDVREVTAFVDTLSFKYKVEDSSLILMKFKNDAHAVIDNNFNIPDTASLNVLEVYGTKGSILAQGTIGQSPGGNVTINLSPVPGGYDPKQNRNLTMQSKILEVEQVDMYTAEIENFADAILYNKTPLNHGEEAFNTQKVLDAAYKSAKSKKIVKLK